jgi:hypothetical protein
MCHPTFREWCKHGWDTSLINSQQRNLEICNNSYIFIDELVIEWPINIVANSLCHAILYLSEIWLSVSLIPSSISLTVSTLYSFCDMTSLWPSNMLASFLEVISLRGPIVYFSVIWMNKSRSWSIRLYYHFQNTKCHLLKSPYYGMTFDVIKKLD